MHIDAAAKVFAELGNRTRLEILRVLIKMGRDGLPVGDIQSRLMIPLSTLAFHIRALNEAGLLTRERQGRFIICRVNFDRVNDSITFLKEECCSAAQAQKRGRAA